MKLKIVVKSLLFLCVVACSNNATKSKIASDVDNLPELKEVTPFDVSLLMPLKSENNRFLHDALLGFNSISKINNQVIIPRNEKIQEQLSTTIFNAQEKVVAVRLDPCFKKPQEPVSQCESQIRLIVNTFIFGNPIDVAHHIFFKVSKEELNLAIAKIIKLRKTYGIEIRDNQALSVHPGAEKIGLEYIKKLNDILLAHISFDRIVKITSTIGNLESTGWIFSGTDFKFQDNTFLSDKIKIVGYSQPTINQIFRINETQKLVEIEPKLSQSDSIFNVLKFNFNRSDRELLDQSAALNFAMAIENPNLHSPDTADCVSCHLAEQTKQIAFSAHLEHEQTFEYVSNIGLNLENPFPQNRSNLQNMRIFGYFKGTATVSQRVINETDVIVEYYRQL